MQTNKQTETHATLISPIKHVTRKFHVVVMEKKRQRNVQKSVLHVQSCFFFLLIRPIFFFFFYAVAIAVAI